MSRSFVVFAVVCALGLSTGVALAGPPGGVEPGNPIPGSCDLAEIHPVACLVFVVSCSPTSKSPVVCTTVRVSGPRSSSVRVLAIRLSKHYAAISLLCLAKTTDTISCHSLTRTMTTAVGTRLAALRLPQTFATLHVVCGTSASGGFACKLGK